MDNNKMNIIENRDKAIKIIEDRTDLRITAYKEVIETFKELETRTLNTINYINHLKNLLLEDINILIQYQTEFIEERDIKGYWRCEKIKAMNIIMMEDFNEVL